MNSLPLTRLHNESIIVFPNSLWRIHVFFIENSPWRNSLFRKITINSMSRTYYLFRGITMNPVICQRSIFYPNSLSFSQIYYLFREFTISVANLLRIHNFFREFTFNSLSVTPYHYGYIIFRQLIMFPWCFSRNQYRFIISLIELLWIHYNPREFITLYANSLSFSQIHDVVRSIIFFANSELIHCLFCKLTVYQLLFSWNS